MAYLGILDTQLDPDAPITSGLGYQLRDNPEARMDGDVGAPRILGKAINPLIGTVVDDAETIITGIEHISGFTVFGSTYFSTTAGISSAYMRFAYSTDNGSTWSPYIQISDTWSVDSSNPPQLVFRYPSLVDIALGCSTYDSTFTASSSANAIKVGILASNPASVLDGKFAIYCTRG